MKPLAALAKGICLFCAIFAAQAMAFADVAERTAPLPPAEVLIINSFHSGHFWEYNIIKRISEELENTETGFRIRLHCEYLDYERHPPGSLDNELVSLFARKYAGVSLKAIIVTDNDALDFMLAHGNRLFLASLSSFAASRILPQSLPNAGRTIPAFWKISPSTASLNPSPSSTRKPAIWPSFAATRRPPVRHCAKRPRNWRQ
ncbi:MAG: hypothetical protein ACLSAH_18120 [Bilophila wadsworthia]